jgi:hypothetical protein
VPRRQRSVSRRRDGAARGYFGLATKIVVMAAERALAETTQTQKIRTSLVWFQAVAEILPRAVRMAMPSPRSASTTKWTMLEPSMAMNGRLAAVVFYSLLMVSGAGVRLTGSGLG